MRKTLMFTVSEHHRHVVPRLDESFMQGLLRAEYAIYYCDVCDVMLINLRLRGTVCVKVRVLISTIISTLFSPIGMLAERAIHMFYVEFEMSMSIFLSLLVRLSPSLMNV